MLKCERCELLGKMAQILQEKMDLKDFDFEKCIEEYKELSDFNNRHQNAILREANERFNYMLKKCRSEEEITAYCKTWITKDHNYLDSVVLLEKLYYKAKKNDSEMDV